MRINFKTSFFHRNKKQNLNQGPILNWEKVEKNQYFKLIIKEVFMYK